MELETKPKIEMFVILFRCRINVHFNGVRAVSYTHLDVYKRQVLEHVTNFTMLF